METSPQSQLLYNDKHRVVRIDFCRIATAFCVIVRHSDRPVGSLPFLADLLNYRSLVFFFFLMAGYFTSQPREGERLGIRRALRLLWPYLFWGMVAFYIIMPFTSVIDLTTAEGILQTARVIGHSFYRAFGLHSWHYFDLYNVPLWFLRVLIVLSLAAPLLWKLTSKAMVTLILICFAGSDVLCFADAETALSVGSPHHAISGLPFRLYESVLALGFFCGGLLMRRHLNIVRLTSLLTEQAWLPIVAALAMLPAVYYCNFVPPIMSSALVALGVACNMSVGCLCMKYLPKLCTFVAAWGPAAFFVYVTHYPLLELYKQLLADTPIGSGTAQSMLAPWILLIFCLILYRALMRVAPRFMRIFALSK